MNTRIHVYLNSPAFAAGFRIFFPAAALAGAVLVPAFLSAYLLTPASALETARWHAHEMVFGFAGAVIAGFLLSQAPQWSGLPPLSRPRLAALFALWLGARLSALATLAAYNSTTLALVYTGLDLLFFPALLAALWPALRKAPGGHGIFLVFCGIFAALNALRHLSGLITAPVQTGTVGVLVIVAYLGAVFARVLPRLYPEGQAVPAWLSQATIALSLAFAGWFALTQMAGAPLPTAPAWPGALLALSASAAWFAGLLQRGLFRSAIWSQPLLAVLFAAALCAPSGYLLFGLVLGGVWPQGFALGVVEALHIFASGLMGLFIAGMITRMALMGTGRPVVCGMANGLALLAIALATALRVFGPGLADPGSEYGLVLMLSGGLWTAGFAWIACGSLPLFWRAPPPAG